MTALQKIQKEARRLRNENPKMKYIDAIKLASKNYNAGKLGAAKKVGSAVKKAPVKKRKLATKMPVKKIVTTVTREKVGSTGASALKRFNDLVREIESESKSIVMLSADKKKYPDKAKIYESQIVVKKKYLAELKIQKNRLKKLI